MTLKLRIFPSLVSIGSTIVAFFMTDFVGRRATFLFGVVGTWSCLMIVGGLGLIKTPSLADNKLTVRTRPVHPVYIPVLAHLFLAHPVLAHPVLAHPVLALEQELRKPIESALWYVR